ncbi:MAG: M28 family peptidase [Sphingomicrobium sp.]
MTLALRNWLILALLLGGLAVKGLLLVPPAPAVGSEFDTTRAIGRLQTILGDQRAHPVDSAANDAVRGRILTELAAIGLKGEVREAANCNTLPGFRTVSCSTTRNIVAVIGADRPGKTLLLNAHYDSTPTGPGAADDGIGVATMLEVAANLMPRPPAQPVVLLFNEGEEFGLNGAAAFAAGDPLASRIGSLINIEARGVEGPAWMFETSEPNAAPIAAFAASSARPYANSLSADAAKLIPNYTDVVVFKQAPATTGWRTLSFAVTGNETRYHTPGDRVEWLDRASLNHMGTQVLAAARTLPGAADGGQRVYADIAGRWLINLPFVVAEVLLGLLLGAALYLGWRERAFGRPLLACIAAVVAGVAAAFALDWLGTMVRAGDYWRATPLIAYLALYAALIATMAAVLGWLRRGVSTARLRVACWLLILGLGAILSLFVHGAIIFFLIAPALALAGIAIPPARAVLVWSAILLQLVMIGELAASIEVLLVDGPLAAAAAIAALAVLPVLVEIADKPLLRPALAMAAIALALWIGALVMPRASAARPAAFAVDYVRDDIERQSHWSAWTKQAPLPAAFATLGSWRRGTLSYSGRARWLATAPMLDVPGGSLTKIGQIVHGGQRRVRLRFGLGGGDAIALRIDGSAAIRAMGMPGKLLTLHSTDASEPFVLRCMGRACDGMTVEVQMAAAAPVEAMLITTGFALPPQGEPIAARRPANAQPQYGPDSSTRLTAVVL